MKIRRVSNEEQLSASWPLRAYAFEPSPNSKADLEKLREWLPYNAGNATVVIETDAGEPMATATAIPMRQNVRGTVYPMAGIAGVASHPLARRQGHVRTLLTQLLGEQRDEGQVVSTLYPFRSSFYERFGFIGLPKPRTVTFSPADLGKLLRADLPGEVSLHRIKDGYDAWREFTLRLTTQRHGFAAFPDYRAVRQRDEDAQWLVLARQGEEIIGAVTYRIEQHAGTLAADDLLSTAPLGRALLLQFFARHVDQVAEVRTVIAADETPEMWATDLVVRTEATVAFPHSPAPMARILSLSGLTGLACGPGRVGVEVVDDPFLSGRYRLDGGDGQLDVREGQGPGPVATLTCAGLSALVYGVLDPAELPLRGLGTVPEDAAGQLRSMFPRAMPYVFAQF